MPANKHRPKGWKLALLWLPVVVCMSVIFYTSSQQSSDLPELFTGQDIVFHLTIYFVLALFFVHALKNTYPRTASYKLVLWTILFGMLYGLLDEFHQAFVPTRCPDLFDVFMDTVGVVTGSLIYPWKE